MIDMTKKTRIAILFGGRSGEHEVSLMSAQSILSVLDPNQYDVTQIGITHEGQWLYGPHALEAFSQGNLHGLTPVLLLPEPGRSVLYARRADGLQELAEVDAVFPALHGSFGEDGTLQGLLELADFAYVGAGVLASSVGMDKALFKDVMRANGIPVVDSVLAERWDVEHHLSELLAEIEKGLPYPLFVKPANAGSSVGVSKCRSRSDLMEGLLEAARFDRRILVEKAVSSPREIEVSVLGNRDPQASVPGEIRPGADFYTYEAKYLEDTSELLIPAPIPTETAQQVRDLAVRAYRAIDCAGMARVDFLLDGQSGELFLGELNTIPGFTRISMYPKLWEASGLPYAALVKRLIDLALERKSEQDRTERRLRRDS
jgi:D-alanine-D-alanine ligase